MNALILAGSRGPDDPMARAAGVSHKALLPVAGVPMLLRVVEALRALPDFEGRSSLSTWLYRIAVNEALMMMRRRKGAVISIDADGVHAIPDPFVSETFAAELFAGGC